MEEYFKASRMTHRCWCVFFAIMCILCMVKCLHDGDRFLASSQTMHNGWKTPKIDMALTQMPRFREEFSTMFRVHMPRKEEISAEMDLDPTSDVKTSFTFFHDRLIVPWVLVYDAKRRRVASRITFTFAHDEFEVLRAYNEVEYDEEGMDDGDAELPMVELYYEFEAIQEEDLARGVFWMFLTTLVAFVLMIMVVFSTYDRRFKPSTAKAAPPAKQKRSGNFSSSSKRK